MKDMALAGALAVAAALAGYGALIEQARMGEAPGDNYGESVAGGGDVDGDGAPDHLVTAIFNDEAASAAGKAYLYLGRAPARAAADLTFLGEAADDQFGVSAAVGGDVNGDGYDDLVIGARFNDRAGKDVGAAFVYFGGPAPGSPGGMDAAPDLILTGERQDDWFGNSVDFAGDVNADGYDDVIVGAPFNDDRGSASGKAYIYFGGASPDATPDVMLYGDSQSDGHFGWSVSRAGDVNRDGYGDVVVGARLFGTGPSRAQGRAYLFLGSAAPDGVPDISMNGERHDDWFGNTVSEAGDFNGDGYGDVAVGAIFWDDLSDPLNPKSAAGKVYVFFGGPTGTLDGVADWSAAGERSDDHFGFAIASAGDVDGNGDADLIAGARFYDDLSGPLPKSAVGKVYLYFGGAGPAAPSALPGFTRTGLVADDQLGNAVAGAGDGNLEGLDEPLAGAHFADAAGSGSGSATLHFLDCLDLDVTGSQVTWGGCGAYDAFELRRGDPGGLSRDDFGSCLAGSLSGPPVTDGALPVPGRIFTYLVAGRGQALQPSFAIGFGSSGRRRPPQAACP